jgi:tetratricopeptide (TPR) repeat protein
MKRSKRGTSERNEHANERADEQPAEASASIGDRREEESQATGLPAMRYRFTRPIGILLFLAVVACGLAIGYQGYVKRKISELELATKAVYKEAASLAADMAATAAGIADEDTISARELEWDEAWKKVERNALEWHLWEPDLAKPLIFAAEAAGKRGNTINKALYLYELVKIPAGEPGTAADRDTVAGLLELSDMQFQQLNEPKAGAATCLHIIKIEPKNRDAHHRLGFYYAMSRQRTEMIAESRRAIAVGAETPDSFLYLMGADWLRFSNGETVNVQWVQSDPEYEPFRVAAVTHYFYSLAMTEETVTEEGKAQSKLIADGILDRFPKNLEALCLHLDLGTFRGQVDQVIKLLETAPKDSAQDSRFWRYSGWVHEQTGNLKKAEEAYKKSLEIHPYDERTYHWLAGVCRQLGKVEESEKYQQLAVLGTEIKRESLQLPDTLSLPPELLKKMADYADGAGDKVVAERLLERVRSLGI